MWRLPFGLAQTRSYDWWDKKMQSTWENQKSVIEDFHTAWNVHDVDGVVSRFTDDAVITIVPSLPTASDVYIGKEEIRKFVEENLPGFHADAKDFEVVGNVVSWEASFSSDGPWLLGVSPAAAIMEAVLEQGKIKGLTIILAHETVERLLIASTTGL
jgi:hypothetical protein